VSASSTLILGGARSGKSRYAEALITALPAPWAYVATAQAGDDEMAARIADHRARRGANWRTIEAPYDLAAAIEDCADSPILIDCLTLWLSNILLAGNNFDAAAAALERALASCAASVVLVSNEVGSGVVPDHPLGRRFRDLQGLLNQRIAARADHVVLVVAGLPLTLKSSIEEPQ
jgi:adenosyl cobinamide kinase/adenosyl cobinamide phosphate guanylyltransferase